MFKVYLNGVYHSSHETFTGACRYARTQANINKYAYFTVFEAGDKSSKEIMMDAEQEVMKGVPAYIITPNAVMPKVQEKRRAGIANLAAAASRYTTNMSRGI
ncbi:hypothetical protein [Thiothrix lacustris]|uniref:Uncharacterized protein n=1 Tax=Thiothrix lacustris TaxID=525917 RepID=A0ABY9MP25_9GAMM|nr:hypothetical protein [Thiothrix lacustris]WML90312.1 hypothetical protein RCF98_15245 [Thiothrix lacustris]WMP16912.1 hypothetical protein RCS87_16245 [Thiothrix lacustris]